MMERDHSQLSLRRQAQLLDINRNRLEPRPRITGEDRRLMRELDELHTRWPVFGQRKLMIELRRRGWPVGRKRVRRLMGVMGLEAIAPKPRTSQPSPEHKKYPYLLRDLPVTRPDQVWCADITYLPIHGGFAYLVAIMDWHSRAVLAWRINNTLEAGFCVAAYQAAVRAAGGAPEIMNTDQGVQFTGREWITAVESSGARVSMDGRGRWLDNVFIERLWRSLKCEDIYLRDYGDLAALETGVRRWLNDYNHERIHQGLGYARPWDVYRP
ncbi:MAG TPA: IS3 family transposase, partial [Verrucomicrobiales bacterium]|nr:IS3 family transposase [Verrucomicrobiales bacterium]